MDKNRNWCETIHFSLLCKNNPEFQAGNKLTFENIENIHSPPCPEKEFARRLGPLMKAKGSSVGSKYWS